jgi:hypothetical protein
VEELVYVSMEGGSIVAPCAKVLLSVSMEGGSINAENAKREI